MSRHGANRLGLIGALMFTAAVGLAACSGSTPVSGRSNTLPAPAGPSSADQPVQTPPVSATGTTVADVAVNVYLAMWNDMVVAGKTADYQSPQLADHAASQAWQLLYGGLLSAHRDGVVLLGQPTFAPRVTETTPSSNPTTVTIVDCMDSTNWREYTRSGQLRDDEPGGKHRATATVGLLDGTWKVTRLRVEGVGTCT